MEPESQNYGKLLWAMVMATAVAGGLTALAEHSFSSPTRVESPTFPGNPVYVEFVAPSMEGAVYRLPPDATVRMLLAAVRRDDVRSHQTDRRLRSGERVEMDEYGTLSFGVMGGARLLALGLRVPLNRAGADDLVVLPGIGERMAMKIIDFRERNGAIASYDDLLWIPGIGPKALEVLKRHTSL